MNDSNNEITDQQKDFCKYYIETKWNGTESAKLAGYSENTATEQASRLLRNVKVREYLSELIEDTLGKQRGQLRYDVLSELTEIAFADVTNDINVVTKEIQEPVLNEDGLETGETVTHEEQVVEIIDTKKSKQSRAIKSIKQDRFGAITIEYHDKNSALDKLGKYGGLWVDQNINIDNSDHSINNTIDYSSLSPEEAKQLFMNKLNEDK